MNAAAFDVLANRFDVNYAGPIDPPAEVGRKTVSKMLRMARFRGDFSFFSQSRLQAIAAEVAARCRTDASADFFHGFTPWISVEPQRPYLAWGDCTFRDYVSIYHERSAFRRIDLFRLEKAEAAWMRRANGIAFTNDWAAKRAIADYNLDANKVVVVGIFGEVQLPEVDNYRGSQSFAFVSTNFKAKGGPVVLEAFERVRVRHRSAQLILVGDAPKHASRQAGVSTTGYLRKENSAENAQLNAILGDVRAVVHPTRSDIAPLLLVEAGYFGCPVISSHRFAIPEILADKQTGILLDNPDDPAAVAQAMSWMLEADEAYTSMRKAAWQKSRRELTKARFGARLFDFVETALLDAAR